MDAPTSGFFVSTLGGCIGTFPPIGILTNFVGDQGGKLATRLSLKMLVARRINSFFFSTAASNDLILIVKSFVRNSNSRCISRVFCAKIRLSSLSFGAYILDSTKAFFLRIEAANVFRLDPKLCAMIAETLTIGLRFAGIKINVNRAVYNL